MREVCCASRGDDSTRRWRRSGPRNGCKRCWPTSTHSRCARGRACCRRRYGMGRAGRGTSGDCRDQRCRARHLRDAHRRSGHLPHGLRPGAGAGRTRACDREARPRPCTLHPRAPRRKCSTRLHATSLGDTRAAEASMETSPRPGRATGDRPAIHPRARAGRSWNAYRAIAPLTPRCARPSSTFSPAPRQRSGASRRGCSMSSARRSCASSDTFRPTCGRPRSPPSCSCRPTRSGRINATSTPSSAPTAAPRRSRARESSDCSRHQPGRGERRAPVKSSKACDDGSPSRTPACGRRG